MTEAATEQAELVDAQVVGADLLSKVDAGAALVYALYHSPADFVVTLPKTVVAAYGRACKVYRVDSRRE